MVTGEPLTDEPVRALQLVATVEGPMPTGVTVSHSGRIVVNDPTWRVAIDAGPVLLRP